MLQTQCLNGWWDFLPVTTPQSTPPATGWKAAAVLTPSWWTKSRFAVRRQGERYFRGHPVTDVYHEDDEFLFDAYGYPLEWAQVRSGWLRRDWDASPVAGQRSVLTLHGVMPRGTLFLNGELVATHDDPAIPWSVDITNFLRSGKNEIAVLIEDFRRDERGRPLVPCGNEFHITAHCGITGDVFLTTHPAVSLEETHIRAVDAHTVDVSWVVRNDSDRPAAVTLEPDLAEWKSGIDVWSAPGVLAVPPIPAEVPAGSRCEFSVRIPFPEARPWDSFEPNLYWLRSRLLIEGQPCDRAAERMGFRAIRIEGKDILINEHPVHFFSDWGHKTSPYHLTETWIRQWFGMLRDAHMNHTRLHAYVQDERILEIADEMGIYVTIETGIHGSGREQGSDSPAYWEAARRQVRDIVRLFSNHPCVVLWSVENEMRWNADETPLFKEELPKLRQLFNELDPTRPAYHEGDTSLWDEGRLEIINRHYGKEVAGYGWWDQKRPLHSGEMSLHHLMGPNNTLSLGGDHVFENYATIERAASEDALLIVESARVRGVCALAPWNLSCNVNPRMDGDLVRLSYPDWSAPGAKPIFVPPHSSEFRFWDAAGKAYTSTISFDLQRESFRPLAVIDESRRSQFYSGTKVVRHLHVVNDTAQNVEGTLRVRLGDQLVHESRLAVERGRVGSVEVAWTIADFSEDGNYPYAVSFDTEAGCDAWERPWFVARAFASGRPLDGISLNLVGAAALAKSLEKLGATVRCLPDLANADPALDRVILVAPFALNATAGPILRGLLDAGARIVLLEQNVSVFPGLPMKEQEVVSAWKRSPRHPVVENIGEALFKFWGDTPYPALDGDLFVIRRAYTKGDARHAACLADTGDGGFGYGDLEGQAILEVEDANGLLLACQLLIGERLGDLPVAELLVTNLIRRAVSWNPRPPAAVEFAKEYSGTLLQAAENGATVVINNPSDAVLAAWADALGVRLETCTDAHGIYQAVRASASTWVEGVSQHDLCGIESWTYSWLKLPDKQVASRFLLPSPRLEEVLVTATRSCLRELYLFDGSSEMLRAHTASRFCYGSEPASFGILAGAVRHGRGVVLFSLLDDSPDATPRLVRWQHAIRRNAGGKAGDRIWDAPRVEPANRSEGFPGWIHRCLETHGADGLEELVAATKSLNERFYTQPMLAVSRWERIPTNGGAVTSETGEREILAGTVNSPRPRKNVEISVLNCPNPEEQVFCDVEGGGTFTFFLNGREMARADLREGPVTVPDIELETGNNHYLIAWHPDKPGDTLHMLWRNIMRTPEKTLEFS